MIKMEAEVFGLLFLGYDATIKRTPFLKIMPSGWNIPVAVLETVYFQDYLSDGSKKNLTFMCTWFLEHMTFLTHQSISQI